MALHQIQTQILTNLLLAPNGLRFSQAIPAGIEQDSYNYHLNQLIKHGLVHKRYTKYYLSRAGKYFVEEISALDPTGRITPFFRVAALMIVLKEPNQVLYQTRLRHPMYRNKLIPGRPIHKGETTINAAKRGLEEETGLVADFRHLGTIRKTYTTDDNQILSDIFFQVCLAEEFQGELIDTDFGQNYWISLAEAISHERSTSYGSSELANVLQSLLDQQSISTFYKEEKLATHNF